MAGFCGRKLLSQIENNKKPFKFSFVICMITVKESAVLKN